jgi:HAD superfamily hydrolase (TIGR01509 family)
MLSTNSKPSAVIFDMDGVLVDSNPYHLQKWIDFLNEHRIPFDEAALPKQILGSRNDTAFRIFFGPQLTAEDMHRLGEELEENFRKVFGPHAKPLPGLQRLIEDCHAQGVLMAVASSAMSKNVEFIVEALRLRPYLQAILSGDEVSHPKPDPEIYLKTAQKLGQPSGSCVAFEDSFVGVEAAKRAGMKCVAIASTFPMQELRAQTRADLIVPGFEHLSLDTLRQLFAREPTGSQREAP